MFLGVILPFATANAHQFGATTGSVVAAMVAPHVFSWLVAVYGLYHNVEGDVIGWIWEDVFAWSYTPLKGGLYGAIIIAALSFGVLLMAPRLLFPDAGPSGVTGFLITYLGVSGLAWNAGAYVLTRTAGPASSYAVSVALAVYVVNAIYITIVARSRAHLSLGLNGFLPLLLVLASLIAGLIHDHLHSSRQVAAPQGRTRAARK